MNAADRRRLLAHAGWSALALVLILAVGAYAYVAIPKESAPEIPIPMIYVSTTLEGISPEDAERLLVEPLETELGALTGLDEMEAIGRRGLCSVKLEFEPGFDADEALDRGARGGRPGQAELPERRDRAGRHRDQHRALPDPDRDPVRAGAGADAEPHRRRPEGPIWRRCPGVLEVEIGGERDRAAGGADRPHGLRDLQPLVRRADQPDQPQQPADRRRRDRHRGRAHRAEGAGPDRGRRRT